MRRRGLVPYMGSSRYAAALLTCAGLLAVWGLAWSFTVDDAYIAGTYARRLAAGLGYTFRAGPASDGVTGPLWLLPLVAGTWLGGDAIVSAKIAGGACAAVAVWSAIAYVRGRALGRAAALFCGGVCLSSVPLALWPVAGLETGAATLASTSLALAALRCPRPSGPLAGVCATALAWLRPELACFAAVLLVAVWWRDRRAGRSAWLLALLGIASVCVLRWLMFRHVLPMSAFAKPPWLEHGASYVARALARPSLALPALALAFSASQLGPRERWTAGALLAHLVALVLAGGDWMAGLRLFTPVVPSGALLFALTWSRVAAHRPRFAWALFAVFVVVRGSDVAREASAARAAGTGLARTAQRLVDTLRGGDGPIVALDVGALSYFHTADIIDLGGLTEPRIAYARGGHLDKFVDRAWLEAQDPAFIVLHSRVPPRVDELGRLRWFAGYPVERRVLAMPWVALDYRVISVIEHSPSYFYVVLQRGGRIPR